MLNRLLTGSAFLFAVRLGGAGIGFLTQILLARMLGSHELGLFYSVTSLAAVGGFVMSQGYSQIVYRFSARYRKEGKAFLFKKFVSRAAADALLASTAAAAIVVLCSYLLPDLDPSERMVWALGGALIIPSAALVLFTNLAGAIRMFGWCYVPEGIFKPALFMAMVVVLWAVEDTPNASEVMFLFSVMTVAISVAVMWKMIGHLPRIERPGPSSRRITRHWRAEARPLVLLSLYTNSFADVSILLATPFISQSELAIFGVCLKISLLIGYFVQIAQQMAIPDLADARERRDEGGMLRAARRAVLLPLAITTIAMLACIFLGSWMLGLFGPEFATATTVLVVMVASQLVRAAAGPSAHLLTLTGAQMLNASLCIGALAILALANAVLGPLFGPVGAAWAVFVSYTAWIIATAVSLIRLGEIRTDLAAIMATARAAA